MRCSRSSVPALLAVTLAACAPHGAPEYSRTGGDRTVLVVDAKSAHEASTWELPVEIKFGQRESGTRLVLALMNLASQRGAEFVSDVTFLQVFKWKGELVECATPIAIAGDAEVAAAPAPAPARAPAPVAADDTPTYSTSVSAPRPEQLDVRVAEDVVSCKKVAHSYITFERRYPSSYDVEVPHLIQGDMPMDKVIKVAWTSDCHMEHVVHDVRRWDFQVKLEWTPPDWPLISHDWASDLLADGPPRCYRATLRDIGDPPRHRLRAKLYFRSKFRDSGASPLPGSMHAYGN